MSLLALAPANTPVKVYLTPLRTETVLKPLKASVQFAILIPSVGMKRCPPWIQLNFADLSRREPPAAAPRHTHINHTWWPRGPCWKNSLPAWSEGWRHSPQKGTDVSSPLLSLSHSRTQRRRRLFSSNDCLYANVFDFWKHRGVRGNW